MSQFKYDLTYSGGTITLDRDPVGWEQAVLKLKRDTEYHGVFKEYTFDLQFHCKGGGKTQIDGDYDTKGIQAEVTISISYKCEDGDDWTEIFDGKLDFSKYERTKDFTTVTIVRNDLSKIVLDRIDSKVDLTKVTTVDGLTAPSYTYAGYDLNMHSKEILFKSLWNHTTGEQTDTHNFVASVAQAVLQQHELTVGENALKDVTAQSEYYEYGNGVNVSSIVSSYTDTLGAVLPDPFPVTVEWDFDGTWIDRCATSNTRTAPNVDISLGYGSSLATATFISLYQISSGYTDGTTEKLIPFTDTDSTTINLSSGDSIWLYVSIGGAGYIVTTGAGNVPVELGIDWNTSSISISSNTTKPATTAKAWAIHEAFSRISENVTKQVNKSGTTDITAFKSDFFGRVNSEPNSYASNGCGSFTAVTNGYMIRGFGTDEKQVFVSLDDLYQAMNTIFNIGLGVEYDTDRYLVRVEDKAYFYDKTTTILQCPNIDELTMRFNSEWMHNRAEIGFDKWKVEDLNGVDEPITKQERIMPGGFAIKNPYEVVTDFVAGMYAIEYTRRNDSVDFPTTDTDFDNDNFVIALNRSVDAYTDAPSGLDEAEKDENFASITGLFESDTSYNLRFSPVRCLLRHLNVLGSGLTKASANNDKKLIFSKGYNNYEMSSDMDNDGCPGDYTANEIAETTTISWDDANARLNEPLWMPEVYSFEYPLSFSEWISLVGSPYGVVEFSETDADFKKGYILNLDYEINKGLATFELLRAYES